MKRALLVAVMVVALSGAVAWADSIVVGFGVEPVVGALLSASAGYAGPNWVALGQKADISSIYGVWSLCMLWNPIAGPLGATSAVARWRVGGSVGLDWEPSLVAFGGASLIAGGQIDWGVVSVYLQMVIGGSQLFTPQLGIELRIPLGESADG